MTDLESILDTIDTWDLFNISSTLNGSESNISSSSSNNGSSSRGTFGRRGGNMADPIVQLVVAYTIPAIVLFGVWGNSISLIILKNSARKSAAHLYLCCLSIFDSITLISILTSAWAGVILRGHVTHHGCGCSCCWQPLVHLLQLLRSVHLCRARVYLSFVARSVSTWTIVAFSWQRCAAVLRPLHVEGGSSLRSARYSLLCIVLAASVTNLFVIFGYSNNNGKCRHNLVFRQGRVVALILQSVIPWILILIANCVIIWSLKRGSRHVRRQQSRSLSPKEAEAARVGLRTRRRQRRGVTYRLMVVSLTFLITTFWLTAATAWKSWTGRRPHRVRDNFWILSFVPFTLNFAINFVLYCLVGQKFRRVTLLLLTCRWSRMRNARKLLDPSRPPSAAAAVGGQRVASSS